ncbi:unnamed protein product, partial [Staurois parvus]
MQGPGFSNTLTRVLKNIHFSNHFGVDNHVHRGQKTPLQGMDGWMSKVRRAGSVTERTARYKAVGIEWSGH